MKLLVALLMGFLSGVLVYLLAAMVLLPGIATSEAPPAAAFAGFAMVVFFGGWGLSTFVILRDAQTLSRVFSRGFLLGAAEWLALIPASMLSLGGSALTRGVGEAELAGATLALGFVSAVTGDFAITMALACLLGFAVAHFMGREMQPEMPAPGRTCPECAERIQAAARRCRFCGASLVPE